MIRQNSKTVKPDPADDMWDIESSTTFTFPMLEYALRYHRADINVIPLMPGTKRPIEKWKNFTQRRQTEGEVRQLFSGNGHGGIGLILGAISGGLCAVDFDGDPKQSEQNVNEFLLKHPFLQDTWVTVTGANKFHLLFKYPNITYDNSIETITRNGARIELRMSGHIVVAPPSLHPDTHKPYYVLNEKSLFTEITESQFKEILIQFREGKKPKGDTFEQQTTNEQKAAAAEYFLKRGIEYSKKRGRNEAWYWYASQLRDLKLTEGQAHYWRLKYNGLVSQEPHPYPQNGEDIATLKSVYAREPRRAPNFRKFKTETDDPWTIPSEPSVDLLNFPLTDAGNAETFVALYGDDFRFCFEPGHWFHFDNVRWRDDVLTVKLRAIDAARERQKLAMKIPDDDLREDYLRWLKGSESTGRVRSALELAECHLVKQIYEFDADPFSLCCTNGVINLKNGNFRPAIPEDMLHRSTNVRYNPAAECPRWIQFLSEIFGCNDSVTRGWKSDTDLISFIQKAVGYTLTGSVEEQCLFINYGTGENGKTTFLGIIEKLLGEFSSTLLSDTLKEHKHDNQIPNDSQPIGSPGSWI